MRALRATTAAALTLALLVTSAPASALATSAVVGEFRVIASPFTSDDVSTRHQAGVVLTLLQPAQVTLTIEQPGGSTVRTLEPGTTLAAGDYSWNWGGYDGNGQLLPDGMYVAHLVVAGGFGSEGQSLPVRKGMPPIYPQNPGAITILINPGHGGSSTGAATKRYTEKAFNLDIGLRLQRLLLAAGVNVVMTRSTDTKVNLAGLDLNGDGIVGRPPHGEDWDELQARVDIGNEARADLHIFNHNNGAGCRCRRGTETFTGFFRTWTPEGMSFAHDLQSAEITQLDTFTSATYYPIDAGVKNGKRYFTLSPYTLTDTARRIPRPTLQPAILTESLYVSDGIERGLLAQPQVREALAIAMYLGIRDYLATRHFGIRYQLVDGPTSLPAGGSADYHVEVTNTGNQAAAGWQFQLHDVPSVPYYDGSDNIGDLIGAVDIPDGLAPGESTTLTVHATAPPTAGDWLVKGDVFIGGTDRPYLSQRGVVAIQVPLTTEP